MCKDYLQERKELVEALHKGRRFANLPKITQVISLSVHTNLYKFKDYHCLNPGNIDMQPTLMIWGEEDQVFPVELAHRLKRSYNLIIIFFQNHHHFFLNELSCVVVSDI